MNIDSLKTNAQAAMADAIAQDALRIVNKEGIWYGTSLCFSDRKTAETVYDYLLVLSVTPPYDADKLGHTPVKLSKPHADAKDTFHVIGIDRHGLMPEDVLFSTFQDGHTSLEGSIYSARDSFAQWMGKDTPFPVDIASLDRTGNILGQIDNAFSVLARTKFLEASDLPKPTAQLLAPDLTAAMAHLSPASPAEVLKNMKHSDSRADLKRLHQEPDAAPQTTVKAFKP